MRFCKEHWEALSAAIKEKGLWGLVSKSGEAAKNKFLKEIKGGYLIKDPLMTANFAIMNNAIERGGIYLLTNDENGKPYCPLCEVKKNIGEDEDKKWIVYAVNEQYDIAIKTGILNKN